MNSRPEGVLLDIELADHVPHMVADSKLPQYVKSSFKTAIVFRLGETLVLSDNPAIASVAKSDSTAQAKTVRLNIVRVDEIPST